MSPKRMKFTNFGIDITPLAWRVWPILLVGYDRTRKLICLGPITVYWDWREVYEP